MKKVLLSFVVLIYSSLSLVSAKDKVSQAHEKEPSSQYTQVFNQKEILNTGSTSLEDALRRLDSSISFTQDHGIGLSGMSGKSVLILIDGNKVSGGNSVQADLEKLNLHNISRIEVIHGPASMLYGSEATGGVINIITKKTLEKLNVTTTNRISRKGQFYNSSSLEFANKKMSSLTIYHRKQADGWQLSPYEWTKKWNADGSPEVRPTKKEAVNAFYSDFISQKFNFFLTKDLTLTATGSFFDKKQKKKKEITSYKYDIHNTDFDVSLGAAYALPKKLGSVSLTSYYDNNRNEREYFRTDGNYLAGQSFLHKKQSYSNTELKTNLKLGQHRVTSGLNFVDNYYKDPAEASGTKSAYDLSFYAQDEYKVSKALSVMAGFRLLHHEDFNTHFLPTLSATYKWQHFSVQGTYATSFRAPDLSELYSESVNGNGSITSHPNPDLKPEKSNSLSLTSKYFNKYFTFTVSPFIHFIRDAIQEVYANEQYPEVVGTDNGKYENFRRVRSRGVNLGLQTKVIKDISLGFSYSYLDAQNRHPSKSITIRDKYLSGTSRHSGAVNMNYAKTWNKYMLNANFNGHMQSSTYYEKMNARAFSLWNLNTTHTFNGIKHFTPTLSVGIDNIFNFRDRVPFRMKYATTTPGRSFLASLTLKFNK